MKPDTHNIKYTNVVTKIKNNSISFFDNRAWFPDQSLYFDIIRIQDTRVDTMKVVFIFSGIRLYRGDKVRYEIEFKKGEVKIVDTSCNDITLAKLFEKENKKSDLSPIDKFNYNYITEKDIYYSLNDLISYDSIENPVNIGYCRSQYLKYLSLYDSIKKISFSNNNKFDTLKINRNYNTTEQIKNIPINSRLISNDSDYIFSFFPFNTIEKRESVLNSVSGNSIFYLYSCNVGGYCYHINIKKLSSSEDMNIVYCCPYPIVFIPGDYMFISNNDVNKFYWEDLYPIDDIEKINRLKKLIIKNFKL